MQAMWTVTAPAKVNLYLGVGAGRDDGYHDVTTVFQALDLVDTVTVTPAASLSVTCDVDLGIPAEQNLAFRAARAYADAFGTSADVAVLIDKHIPAGAGLAGGSGNAAAVLAALATRDGVSLDDPRLIEVAARLGSDVPFFLTGGAALMAGRGDRLVRRLPTAFANVAVVKPADPVPTAAAYAAFDRSPALANGPEATIAALLVGDPFVLATALDNNLTSASASIVPEIAEALAWIGSMPGVLGRAMAGSGSAVFAICEDAASAEAVAQAAQARGWWSAATHTRAVGVTVESGEDAL